MSRRLIFVSIALSLSASAQAPQPGDLVLNEVQYDPPPSQPSGNEWLELLNVSGGALDLSGLVVSDAGADAAPLADGTTLGAGGFLVLVRDGGAFAAAHPGVPFTVVDGFPALNNTGDRPAIRVGTVEVDAVPYAAAWGGADASLERRDPRGPSDDAANFGTSTAAAGGTPGALNTRFEADTTPPTLLSAEALDAQSVRAVFSEALDAASAETAANYTIETVGAPALAMLDADGRAVLLAITAPLGGPRAYRLTVRGVADRRGNVLAEATASFFVGEGADAAPGDLVINEFLYDTPAADDPGEFIELLNRTDAAFDLRTFTLNDGVGDDTPITDRAVFVEPGRFAVVVDDPARFAAVFPDVEAVRMAPWSALNNAGDVVVLKQRGLVIDSLRYAPSWGGEDASLERKDPAGPSTAAANWATTTHLRGGTPGEPNSRFEPDVTGPRLVGADVSADGRAIAAVLDEPAEPASVTAAAFTVEGGPAVLEAAYEPGGTDVRLALDAPLPAGASTLVARGLTDLLGNATDRTEATVAFAPDTTPPGLTSAEATSETTVRVTLSEPVTEASATDASGYAVGGLGAAVVEAVAVEAAEGGVRAVSLRLGAALADRTLYTVVAVGLVDLAGLAGGRSEAAFFVGAPDVPAPGDVVVNEILFDPAAGSAGEYVELLNATDAAVFDLRALSLNGGRALADAPAVLLPGAPLAVARDAEAFRGAFPDAPFVEARGAFALPNDGAPLVLAGAGVVIDSVAYAPAWHRAELEDATGVSLERRAPSAPSSAASSWSSSLAEAGGTPSAPNSVGLARAPVEREAGLTVTSPFAPTRGEAAAITYRLSTEAALVRCRIYDGGGRAVRELTAGRLSGPTATLLWDGTGDDGRPLRAGIYVVLLEALDAEGAAADALRGAVVLARPR